jgi:hypothetical protein
MRGSCTAMCTFYTHSNKIHLKSGCPARPHEPLAPLWVARVCRAKYISVKVSNRNDIQQGLLAAVQHFVAVRLLCTSSMCVSQPVLAVQGLDSRGESLPQSPLPAADPAG